MRVHALNKSRAIITTCAIIAFFVFPRSEWLISVATLVLLFISLDSVKITKKRFFPLLLFILLLSVAILGNLFFSNNEIDIFRIFLFVLGFYFYTATFELNSSMLILAIFYLITIQVLYSLNLSFFVEFVDEYYPVGKYVGVLRPELIDINNIVNFRLAGLFHNPNEMAIGTLILYLFYTINIETKNNIIYASLTILCLISILLTGSRSVGFVFILVLLLDNYKFLKRRVILVLSILLVVLLKTDFYKTVSELRVVKEFNSLHENGKQDMILDYDNFLMSFDFLESLFYHLFGRLNLNFFIDSEVGYVFEFFGLIGLIFYIVMLVVITINTDKLKVKYLSIFLLTSGATLLMHSYLIFPCIILLSKLKKNHVRICN